MALAGLLGAVCCLSAATGPAPARAAGPGLGECRPLLWPEAGSGTVTCYQPTHAALVERVAPVRAIDPATAVRRVVALPLTQALIFHGTPGGVRGRPGVVYVFGRPPARSCPPGAHCPRPNDFVVVWEMGGRVTARVSPSGRRPMRLSPHGARQPPRAGTDSQSPLTRTPGRPRSSGSREPSPNPRKGCT